MISMSEDILALSAILHTVIIIIYDRNPPSPTERPFSSPITHPMQPLCLLVFKRCAKIRWDFPSIDLTYDGSAPTAHTTNQEYLTRTARFANSSKEGLKPLVIFSTPPI